MKAEAAVDTMPEFEGLVIQSSNYMMLAKSRSAADQPFEAAVAWSEAGRSLDQLGTRLIEAGYLREGVEDLLQAARSFLETGDHRPADALLERLNELPHMLEVLSSNSDLMEEYKNLLKLSELKRRRLEQARHELRNQMRTPDASHRLKTGWLQKILSQMPGVSDFHWFAAQKLRRQKRPAQALEHYRLCTRLRPEDVGLRFVLVQFLLALGRWQEALLEADRALAQFPHDPFICLVSGWARIRYFRSGQGQKLLLVQAREQLDRILKDPHVPEMVRFAAMLMLSLCQQWLGQKEEAADMLRRAMRDCPAPVSYQGALMIGAGADSIESQLIDTMAGLSETVCHVPFARAG